MTTPPLPDQSSKAEILDLMIERRVMVPWVDRALRSEVPDRWRLAFAEMLDHAEVFSAGERRYDSKGRPLCFECGQPQGAHPGGVECAAPDEEQR